MADASDIPVWSPWTREFCLHVGQVLTRVGRPPLARVQVLREATTSDCGIVCLQMVLGFFGRRVPAMELRRAMGAHRDGVTALSIVKCATMYGLEARGVAVSFDEIDRLPVPAILH